MHSPNFRATDTLSTDRNEADLRVKGKTETHHLGLELGPALGATNGKEASFQDC